MLMNRALRMIAKLAQVLLGLRKYQVALGLLCGV